VHVATALLCTASHRDGGTAEKKKAKKKNLEKKNWRSLRTRANKTMLRLGSRAFSAGAGAVSRASSSASSSVSGVKVSTGIVGLDVQPRAREVLMYLYGRTLEDVKVMPAEVFYRQSVEKFTRFRLDVVQKHDEVGYAFFKGKERREIWRPWAQYHFPWRCTRWPCHARLF
jgi:hypothetical protein